MNTTRVGVIGCGYWGPNLIRCFSGLRECEVVAVADLDAFRLEGVVRRYPAIKTTTSADSLLTSSSIDAVAIATPISTHHDMVRKALRSGKHVLVEKPLAASVAQAEELVGLARTEGRTLMVDHTFIYSGPVQKIKEIIGAGELGDVYYYDSVRVNLGLFQHDVNVLWDLAPHDFSIMTYLLGKRPVDVMAVGAAPVRSNGWAHESLAYVTVRFADDALAHFHVNWLSPVKVRRTLIGGSRKIVVYDHLDPDNQVKVFDRGVELSGENDRYRALVQYRTGDMLAPKVDQTEALENVCAHFLECVREDRPPVTDGNFGLRVVRLLEAAQESMSKKGAAVDL